LKCYILNTILFKVSDIHKDGCKLNWKRPEDDGGIPIEYYLVEKFDTQKGSWIPCGRSPETGSIGINIKTLKTVLLKLNFLQLWQ